MNTIWCPPPQRVRVKKKYQQQLVAGYVPWVDLCEFKDPLVYIANSGSAKTT